MYRSIQKILIRTLTIIVSPLYFALHALWAVVCALHADKAWADLREMWEDA